MLTLERWVIVMAPKPGAIDKEPQVFNCKTRREWRAELKRLRANIFLRGFTFSGVDMGMWA